MTKKIFAMFLAVLMVVSMLPTSVFAAGTCPYKGTGLHTAENCDNTVIGEPVAATCNTPGFTAYKCNACGDEFHDNVTPATGAHTWENVGDIDPTCEKPGYKNAQKCSGCGAERGEEEIKPLGQDAQGNVLYNCDWVITNPQIDCLTGGEQIWKCANCGDEKTVKIDKKAHNWKDFELVVEATKDVPGKAERVCKDCGAKDEVKVYFDHECVHVYVPEVSATCTTNGKKEHYVCRICDAVFAVDSNGEPNDKPIKANDVEKTLRIEGGHKYICPGPASCKKVAEGETVCGESHKATCVDTILTCSVCKKTEAVNVGHEYESDKSKWTVGEEATCTKSGYIWAKCKNCGIAQTTEIVPAKQHYLVTVTIPATCNTYSYSFTYCTREGCTDGKDMTKIADTDLIKPFLEDMEIIPTLVPAGEPVVTTVNGEWKVGEGFYLVMNQTKLGTDLYFTGATLADSDSKLATSNDISKAVKVYLEIVHPEIDNAYYMYFFNAEGVKTYLEIYRYSTETYKSAAVKLTTETPASYFAWNEDIENLVTSIFDAADDKTYHYFLGSKDERDYISVFETKYYASRMKAIPSVVDGELQMPSAIIDYKVDDKAGYNNAAHTLKETIFTAATCTTPGKKVVNCQYCSYYAESVIPAGHIFNIYPEFVTVDDKTIPGTVPATCVAGYRYEKCACGETRKVDLPAYGHQMGTEQKFPVNHETVQGYDYIPCKLCDYKVETSLRNWTDAYKHWDDVTKASQGHGNSTMTLIRRISNGNCTEYGLDLYECDTCHKSVYVKVADTGKHLAPAEINGVPVHKDATCTEKGWDLTYQCQREKCGAIVGAATNIGDKNDIPALGHDFKVADDHECDGCGTRDYNDVHKSCKREGCTVTVPCYDERDIVVKAEDAGDLCETTVLEYYWCEACQDEHIRSFVNAMGHEMKPVVTTDANGNVVIDYNFQPDGMDKAQAPTCTRGGFYYVQCAICDKYEPREAAMLAHENKAGEKFFEKCTDTVTDRHCKNCCACGNKAASHDCTADQDKNTVGVQPCDCVISTECQWNKVLMPSNCSMAPYWAKSCPDCGARENEVVTEAKVYEYVNTAAEGEEPNFEWILSTEEQAIIHMGHKPAEVDYVQETKDGKLVYNADGTPKMVEKRLPGFTYEEYTYVWYTVVEGKLYKNTDTYTAKFIERKDASYAEEGYDHFVCQICNSEEKNMIAKKTGLGFELNISNDVVTYGTLVEIVVSANGNNAAVHGFDFTVAVPAGTQFVGYEKLNDNFNMVVTAPEKADNEAKLSAFAVNTAEGKKQNVVIDSETALVKLFFRVTKDVETVANGFVASVVKANTAVSVLKNDVSTKIENFENFEDDKCNTQMFLDFNKDGFRTSRDLHDAMSMITLESNKTYDVTVDVNKDGVVDLQDLSIAYNYLVGNYDLAELLVMGISAEELAHLDLAEKVLCNNPACKYELDADWNRCPMCGNYQ